MGILDEEPEAQRGLLAAVADWWNRGGLAGSMGMEPVDQQISGYQRRRDEMRASGAGMTEQLLAGRDNPMLGAFGASVSKLPMDDVSRMARAAKQGFTIDAYKGMPSQHGGPSLDWKGRVLKDEPWIDTVSVDSPGSILGGGYAGFFSDDPGVASRFTEWMRSRGMVMPAKLKMQSPVVIDMGGKKSRAAQFPDAPDADMAAIEKFKAALSDPGVDGIILKNTADEGTVYVPKNPEQVRSRFAQFDPASAASKNILAGAGGLGLIGLMGEDGN